MEELASIVIIEDDATIRALLEMALLGAGFRSVASFARGDEGLAEVKRRKPDLVLLDVMLPGLDGYAICERIRENPALAATRIIMLTARTQVEDIVRGLSSGADDYVTKPFERVVLLARVRAVLRRGLLSIPQEAFDGLTLDEENRKAVLAGNVLKLAPGEFRILALLLSHRGRVLTRARILEVVASDGNKDVSERTIDVQVANLRRKLGDWAVHLETIRGVGYRVVGF
jgi:two-component system phosphate regulon response regulator PhoB